MDYSTLRSARRASCLNAKLYGGRRSFPRLPRASSLLSTDDSREKRQLQRSHATDFPRSCAFFSLSFIGRSRLFFLLLQIGMKSSHKAVISYGVFWRTRYVVGKCPFHARLCQSYDSWEENSGDATILSFSMQFWQICVDWDKRFCTWCGSLENYVNRDER